MLKVVRSLDPDTHNIVRFHEGFFYRGLTCLVFEQLHMSLLDYMRQTHFKPLSLNEIRPITVQLATAFKALKSIGLIHTDLKLDNIMLVDQVNQPFRVKLIDFGLAVLSSEVQRGSILQPLGYRAPEVVLGLPISEAIDMWSLGCVMAAMFLGRNLYPSWKEFDMMRAIVATQGMPADHLLDAGLRTRCLFTRDSKHQTWRLKLPWEYFRDTGKSPRCPSRFRLGSLDVLLKCKPEGAGEHEEEDIQAFVDLLKRMLNLDAAQRITPSQALRHRFLSMTHLAMGYHHSSYVMDSFDIMSICPLSELSWGSEINETCNQQDQNPMTSLTDSNGGGDDKEEGDIKGVDDKLEVDIKGGDDKEEGDIEGGDDKEESDIEGGDDKEEGEIEGVDDKLEGDIEGGDDKEEGDIEGVDDKLEGDIEGDDKKEGDIEGGDDKEEGDIKGDDKETGDIEGGDDKEDGDIKGVDDKLEVDIKGGDDKEEVDIEGGDDKEEGDIEGADDKLEGDIEGGDDKEEGDIEGGDDKEEGDIEGGDDKEEGDIEGDDKLEGDIEGVDDKLEGDIEGGDDKEEGNIEGVDDKLEGDIEGDDKKEGDIEGADDKEEGNIEGVDNKLEGDIEGGDDKEEGDIEGVDDKLEGDIEGGHDKEEGDIEEGDDKEEGDIEGGDDKEEGDIEGGDVKEEDNIKREDGVEEGNIERENDEYKGYTGDSNKAGLIQREEVEKKGDRRENGGGEQMRSEGAGCRDKIGGEKDEGLKRESKRKGGRGRWRKSWISRKRKGKDEEEGKEEKAEEAEEQNKEDKMKQSTLISPPTKANILTPPSPSSLSSPLLRPSAGPLCCTLL
ncbi:uncharacterized protein DDB_G0290685-like [Lampris incognitus]|uniref:uncharacterized protein DDB_G0290685-like n=1 Tax=Lampris incognitus TaxID=2546036 RepID=UPI0024B50B46|nr:uncharacterized protein DDB_G0290685-like [Lampris incognitus]